MSQKKIDDIKFCINKAREYLDKIRDYTVVEYSKKLTLDDLRMIRDVVDTACECEAYAISRMEDIGDAVRVKICREQLEALCQLLSTVADVVENEERGGEE